MKKFILVILCTYTVAFFLKAQVSGPFPIAEERYNSFDEIHFGDIDGDGDQDIIALQEADSMQVFFLENIGGGQFSEAKWIHQYDVKNDGWDENFKHHLFIKDINKDGFDDVVFSHGVRHNVFTLASIGGLISLGNGDFRSVMLLKKEESLFLHLFNLLDIDQDQDLDIITVKGNSVVAYLNDGNANFDTLSTLSDLPPIHKDFQSLFLVDIDHSGTEDILITSQWGPKQLTYIKQNNDSSFEEAKIIDYHNNQGYDNHFQFVDVNGDQLPDIIESVLIPAHDNIFPPTIYLNWYPNRGNASFGQKELIGKILGFYTDEEIDPTSSGFR